MWQGPKLGHIYVRMRCIRAGRSSSVTSGNFPGLLILHSKGRHPHEAPQFLPFISSTLTMPYSASTAFLEALLEGGIKYIYGNFGSDHPAILESLAEAKKTGRKMPEVLTMPIEQVGLHVAMGYAHVRGQQDD